MAFGTQPDAVSQFQNETTAFSPTNSPNSLQNIISQVMGSIAGTSAYGGVQANTLAQEYGIQQGQYELTTANLNQQAANQLAQLGIQNQQLDISALSTEQQAALLGTTSGLEQQEYQQQATQYPEQQQQADINYQVNRQNLLGNLGATGATNTVGAHAQEGLLAQNYGWQTQDITRAKTLADLQQKGTLAQQQYSAEQIANQQKNIQLIAQSNGLSAQEVEQQLDYSLKQAGASFATLGPQVLSQLAQIAQGDLSSAQSAASAVGLVSSGLNAIAPNVQQ